MTILRNGNVWINTTSPWARLHLVSPDEKVAIFERISTADVAIEIKNSQGSMFYWLGGWEQFAVGTTSDLNSASSLFQITQAWYIWIGLWASLPSVNLHIQSSAIATCRVETTGTNEARSELKSGWNQARHFYRESDWHYGIFLPKQDGTGSRTVFRIMWNHNVILDWWASAKVWVGTLAPASKLHVYDNNGSVGISQWITIEQDGDWDATIQWLRTGIRRTMMGIDGSDNKLKISTWSQWLSLWNIFTLDTAGNMGLWNLTSPTKKLHVSGTAWYLSTADMWSDATDFAHKEYVDTKKTKVFHEVAMRVYLRTDWQWTSLFDDNYWSGTENATEYAWIWTDPIIEWENQWHLLLAWQQVTGLDIIGRTSAADIWDLEIRVWIKKPTWTNSYNNWIDNDAEVEYQELFSGLWTEAWWGWNIVDRHYKNIPLNYTATWTEELLIFFKWTTIPAAQRYFYNTVTINKLI